MAKPKNDVESVTITISTTINVRYALQKLVITGFYGKNPAEAAERLLAKVLEQYVLEGRLDVSNGIEFAKRGVKETLK